MLSEEKPKKSCWVQ